MLDYLIMYVKQTKKDISVKVDIITLKDIPSQFYFHYNKKFKNIFKLEFSNDITFYYGSIHSYINTTELLVHLTFESNIVKSCETPLDLRYIFKKKYGKDIVFEDSNKIFQFYKQYQEEIDEIITQFLN